MEKVIGGQGTGKTKELIRIANENNATLVCQTPARMAEKAHAYGYVGIPCISYEEYIALAADRENAQLRKYVVDDIESFLYYISKGTIAFSVSNS